MNPAKVVRSQVTKLTDLPNVGPSIAEDLKLLGIHSPSELKGQDPIELYDRLCTITRQRHDPCVADVFISITRFINGKPAKSWWEFTAERKVMMAKREKER
jgi:hypothetical protein